MDFLTTVGGSAFVAAIVATTANWLKEILLDRRRRKRDFVELQLRCLYGPLHFFAEQNESIIDHMKRISAAADTELVEKKWSEQESTQARLSKVEDQTIGVGNRYADRAIQNGKKMTEVLQQNWSMVDPEDIDIFSRFQLHYMRLETERLVDPGEILPRVIHQHLGDIEILPREFADNIKNQFARKVQFA